MKEVIMSSDLRARTALITGGSRGIGREIALALARSGANVVIAAKTAESNERLPGTIHTVAEEIEAAGGKALALQVDVRDEVAIAEAIGATVDVFGGLDILVNNASAISPTGLLETPLKRYDLLMDVNTRGTYAAMHHALPHLLRSPNPHVLTLSPPLPRRGVWFGKYMAYAMSKYGMTHCALGVAEEFRDRGVASNALWPRTMISTDAVRVHYPDDYEQGRHPRIMADAAMRIFAKRSNAFTGQCLIDEAFLRDEGVTDFEAYAVTPGIALAEDILME
ncbi:SDR family oxidoreductase [Variovorax boronicumulans]|uniref:SDR family oxidoreductase n=1 Tax=Variovorax boronicumulans TaxID=436515 RepID=UPI00209C5BDA|nr:NAD(P)-dependent oxidoreductase [Variovorax boronicumulans]